MNVALQNKTTILHNKPTIGNEEIRAVEEALRNRELVIGTRVKEFEMAFSKYIGINSLATSSGTSALHLALIAVGVCGGDEVILPSYTCNAVAYPVLYQQAKPILVDVNYLDFNIDIDKIINSISSKTKAIIAPHMFGYPADIQEIKKICNEHDIFLIEDCAQSLGALYAGKKVGNFGDISIFSFYATKMITSIQGGMLCTGNKEWIETIRELRYHDQQCSLDDKRLKYSYMMSDIGAAVGIEQLKKLDKFIKRRIKIANLYKKEIINVEHPLELPYKKHVYSRYVIKTNHKIEIIQDLKQKNIICATMHSPPLHRKEIFAEHSKQYPITEKIIDTSISLPIYPSLKDKEILYVSETFNKIKASYD